MSALRRFFLAGDFIEYLEKKRAEINHPAFTGYRPDCLKAIYEVAEAKIAEAGIGASMGLYMLRFKQEVDGAYERAKRNMDHALSELRRHGILA